MWWEKEFREVEADAEEQERREAPIDSDFFSILSKPKDFYKILEVDYDATDGPTIYVWRWHIPEEAQELDVNMQWPRR